MNAPEWKELFVGCIGAGLVGCYPVFYGLSFRKMYEVSSVMRKIPTIYNLYFEEKFFMKEKDNKWPWEYYSDLQLERKSARRQLSSQREKQPH